MKLPRYEPMLPMAQEVGDSTGFVHEIKWDGFRVLAYHANGQVALESRGGLLLNDRFPEIAGAVKQLENPLVLDGEVIALDQRGRPNFSLLQQGSQPEGSLRYVVFDLLHLRDKSTCSLAWQERRALLGEHCTDLALIIVSPLLFSDAFSSLEFAQENGLEGIVSKEQSSPYLPGRRSSYWRKQKIRRTIDCIVVGVSAAAKRIRSLKAGLYDSRGHLYYVGNVGSGLRAGDLEFLEKAITLLSMEGCPVVNPPETDNLQIWFKPHLVAEIEYLELTARMRLRHPVFMRFRFDKKAQECMLGVDQTWC